MCEIGSPNLIDLSLEEKADTTKECLKNPNVPLIPSPQGRLSLDNNPFDYVQKLASYTKDDPFDFVEKEASLKARENTKTPEVRIGNLLSLSSENEFTQTAAQIDGFNSYNSKCIELDNISPPVNLNTKFTPDSSTADSGSCDSSDSARTQANAQRTRKGRQQRHRLLKLSISNATFNTPMSSRRNAIDDFQNSPASNALLTMENMLASESPLKFVDDDVMPEQPPNKIYTEKDYDADLELLEIPMLKQLNSDNDKILETSHKDIMDAETIGNQSIPFNTSDKLENSDVSSIAALPDIETIRKKLHAKRTEDTNSDITKLITSLKMMICESDTVDAQKKEKVNCLLETLSTTLNSVSTNSESTPPQPIVRQGTFDMDLQSPNTQHSVEKESEVNENALNIDQQISNGDSPEIPEIMIQSSATYDGEAADERAHLNLPQIDPISPPNEVVHPNLNDVMEQIQHFLEQNQLTSQPHIDSSCASNVNNASSIASNPTFIVVMPTISQLPINNESDGFDEEVYNRRRSQSLSIHDKLRILQFPIKQPSPEMNSTDNNDSPPCTSINVTSTDAGCGDFKTPARFLSRRNSISSTTPYTPTKFSRFSMSTMSKIRSNGVETAHDNFGTPSRLNSIRTHDETQRLQPISRTNFGLVKPDPKKKIKISNSILKADGPLKATVPMSKIAPTIITNAQNANCNTSMHLVAKSGHMANTSTPMPPNRSNGQKETNKAYPSACSTPTGLTAKCASNISRFANIGSTPVGKKLAVPSAAAAGLRRRTISEFKANSPMKARSNTQDLNSSTVSTKNTYSKLNANRPSVYSKTATKPRASTSGTNTLFANKNKENKYPDKL